MADGQLRNPGFEDGAYPFDPQGIVYIPKQWTFSFREGAGDRLPRQTLNWGRPNAGCLSPQQFPQREWPSFFESGSQVLWKVWSGRSWPFYVTLTQAVTLTPGARYRFTARVHPDMVAQYAAGGKVFSDDPDIGAVRLWAQAEGQTAALDFVKVGAALPNGQYTAITLDFTAPAAAVTLGVEAYGLFSLENCCFFFDNFSLAQIAAEPQFSPPANNLLVNGSFAEGQAYQASDAPAAAVPAGWLLETRAGQPAAALLAKAQASPADQARLFAIDGYAWRLGGPQGPVEARLWQSVNGLTAGQTYRASALVLPDFTGAASSAQAALTAQPGGQTISTGWQDGAALAFGQYHRLEVSFVASAPGVFVSLELKTQGGAGGWVVGLVALETVS